MSDEGTEKQSAHEYISLQHIVYTIKPSLVQLDIIN